MDAYVPFCAPFLTDLRDRGPFTHISDYYPKMSYVTYERWEPMIPQTGDKAEKFLDFILVMTKRNTMGKHKERNDLFHWLAGLGFDL